MSEQPSQPNQAYTSAQSYPESYTDPAYGNQTAYQGYYQPTGQGANQPYGQQPTYSQGQQHGAGYNASAAGTPTFEMTSTDRTLRLVAFIFNIISLAASAPAIIPLAWTIPMSVISWGIYKGKRANTVAFGVCDLIFLSLIGGILLLCSKKDR